MTYDGYQLEQDLTLFQVAQLILAIEAAKEAAHGE